MIAQFIFNQILYSSASGSTKEKLFKLLRQKLINGSEPVINYNFKGFNLELYLSHDFPFNLKTYPQYSQNLGDIALTLTKKYPNLKAIDVGANIGDSAAIIKSKADIPILCIEGNPRFLDMLSRNTSGMKNISIEKCFVGDVELEVKPINSLGTSYLEKQEGGIPVRTFASILNDHPDFSGVKLLKVDTDGFDNKIIRAAESLLKQSKASVFFEYDPHYLALQNEKGVDIYEFLVNLGYKRFVIFDNLGDHLITLDDTDYSKFVELHAYYNRGSRRYMDIWAIHEEDADIL